MKKKFFVTALISALVLSCFVFVTGLMPEKATAAEGDPPAVHFEVMGASIRKTLPMGLRFEVKINADAANAEGTELGMYLCPTELLTDGKFDDGQLESNVMEDTAGHASDEKYIKKVPIGQDELIVDPDNENNRILRLSLVNLVPSSLDKQFSAMAYIKIGGNEQRSDPIERSVAYVAREAKADPHSGLEVNSLQFVNSIIADSDELALIGGVVDMAEGNRHSGQFGKRIALSGSDELKLRINCKQLEGTEKCSLEMYAKAVFGTDVKINNEHVPAEGFFGRLHFEDLAINNNMVTLSLAGSGDLWIDDIKYTATYDTAGTGSDPAGEGVRRLRLDRLKMLEPDDGDNQYNKICGTVMTKNEEGMVYKGDYTAGDDHSRFYIDNESDFGADVYLAFRFKISGDTLLGNRYKSADAYREGLCMEAWPVKNESTYMQIFDGEGKDWSVYKKQIEAGDINLSEGVDFTKVNGSLNRPGYRMEEDEWYYAVTCHTGVNAPHERNYNVYSIFNKPFEITVADVYTLTEAAKDSLFNCNTRPDPVPELKIANERTLNIGQSAGVNPRIYGIEGVTYTSDDTSVATVDKSTGVIYGAGKGTCMVTATAGGLSDVCAVTVKEPESPPALTTGNGVTEIDLGTITLPEEATGTELQTTTDGYRAYKSKPDAAGGGPFAIENEAIQADDYMVFVMKYSAGTDTDSDTSYPGIMFGDAWCMAINEPYSCLDKDLNDCSGGITMSEEKTDAETWYYIISPGTGHQSDAMLPIGMYYGSMSLDFEFTIAHVYAVTEDVRTALLNGTYTAS